MDTVVKRSRGEWRTLINEMRTSALTQTEWCKKHNINYSTMRSMKRKIDWEPKDPTERKSPPPHRETGLVETTPVSTRFLKLPESPKRDSCPMITISMAGITVTLKVAS